MNLRVAAIWGLTWAPVAASTPLDSAQAQSVPSDAQVQSIAKLRVGTALRLQAASELLEGRYLRIAEDALVLSTEASERRITLVSVDSLWVRRPSTRRGILIGAVIGSTALGGLGFLGVDAPCGLSNRFCDIPGSNTSGLWTAVGAGVGAASGALIGAVVGSAVHRWERRYP